MNKSNEFLLVVEVLPLVIRTNELDQFIRIHVINMDSNWLGSSLNSEGISHRIIHTEHELMTGIVDYSSKFD